MLRNNQGTTMIEFAIILLTLLMVLFGITEFGRVWMTKNVMAQAAREGARLGAVLSPWDTTQIENRVNQILQHASLSNKQVQIDPQDPPQRNDPITVTVTGDFEVQSGTLLPGFSGTVNLSAQSIFRYDR